MTNGGAQIEREYALGLGRVDVCVKYAGQAYPIEIKSAAPKARVRGLEQMENYLARCGAGEGRLVIFDRDPGKSPDEKSTWTTETLHDGKTVHTVGC